LSYNIFMNAKKALRQRNPFLLLGKLRWRLFRCIFPRVHGATNSVLSQDTKPDQLVWFVVRRG
jgi:hypothetical protein